jgi:hypothetical protein
MKRNDVIQLAAEMMPGKVMPSTPEELAEFARIVAEAEREACAELCEDLADLWDDAGHPGKAAGAEICASDIRARGNELQDY